MRKRRLLPCVSPFIFLLLLMFFTACSSNKGPQAAQSHDERGPFGLATQQGSSANADEKNEIPPSVKASAELNDKNNIVVSYEIEGIQPDSIVKPVLRRSYNRMGLEGMPAGWIPATDFKIPDISMKNSYIDTMAADNTGYFYVLRVHTRDGNVIESPIISAKTAPAKLTGMKNPSILIDKVNYFLEVRDGGKRVKRYTILLGSDPVKRKLHQDNATTPEGVYHIVNVQREATFYKAYDISYPNEIDKFRYRFALDNGLVPKDDGVIKGIGGEIQIHAGRETNVNWTFGCIALNNCDIDELFLHPEIGVGTRVTIVGNEISRDDLESIRLNRTSVDIRKLQSALKTAGCYNGSLDGASGPGTMRALGKYQLNNKLPVTCQLDKRTVDKLAGK